MRYSSKNRLQDFEFHDSEFSFVSWYDECLSVRAKHLNVYKDTAQNNTGFDMEISDARITFLGFQLKTFVPSRTWKTDENGNTYTNDPLVIHTDSIARDMLEKELRNSINVLSLTFENGVYELEAIGIDPFFSITFTFSDVTIEWDYYSKKAWYERRKQYKKAITLSLPSGKQRVDAHITYREEDTHFFDGEKGEGPCVAVVIKYNENEIWGHGKDYLWTDAFASLQKKLPNDVKIQCCMTCRHGNMCPAGNTPGEVFCTKDVVITQKSDLFFYTEDEKERSTRSRDFTDICESYQEQSKEYYTYNDYLYYF